MKKITNHCVSCKKRFEDAPWSVDHLGAYCQKCFELKYPDNNPNTLRILVDTVFFRSGTNEQILISPDSIQVPYIDLKITVDETQQIIISKLRESNILIYSDLADNERYNIVFRRATPEDN